MDWQTLMEKIDEKSDVESKQLLQILNESLVKKVIEVYNLSKSDPKAVRDKYISKSKKVGDELS